MFAHTRRAAGALHDIWTACAPCPASARGTGGSAMLRGAARRYARNATSHEDMPLMRHTERLPPRPTPREASMLVARQQRERAAVAALLPACSPAMPCLLCFSPMFRRVEWRARWAPQGSAGRRLRRAIGDSVAAARCVVAVSALHPGGGMRW